MNDKKLVLLVAVIVCGALQLPAQTKDAYSVGDKGGSGLLDPSRFSVHHMMSMGVSSNNASNLQSQSLYTTMMQYKFVQPVTLNLNFGLPLYNTANPMQNLTADNIKSADYFKSMPFDASLSWKPRENLMLQFSIVRRSASDYFNSDFYSPLSPQPDCRGMRW